MNVTITRRSKVGFGYNTIASQVWNKSQTQSFLQVNETTRPDIVGTILTVEKEIQRDSTFQSLRGGTYYTTAWFVKIDGKWRKIIDSDENKWKLNELTMENDRDYRDYTGRKYCSDAVVVEVE